MTDAVKSWIEERRGIYAKRWVERDAWAEAARDWQANFPRALNALEQVLELHKPNETGECPHCGHDFQGNAIEWPCATVQAAEGAINDE